MSFKNSTFPVYHDSVNNVSIVQSITPVTIVLNCELFLQAAELAFKTPQMIFNGHENGAIVHFNDLAYDYPVPEPIVSILHHLWKMDRDKGQPAGIDFVQYLNLHTASKWTYHKNRRLNQYEVVIPCFDLKTLATLEYTEDKPQGVMQDKLPVAFGIPFQYTIQFGMPALNILSYPVVYNNQLVPDEMIPIDPNPRFNAMDESHHGIADEAYEKGHNRPFGTFSGTARFPFYDDWNPPETSPAWKRSYKPLMIFALTVDEQNEFDVEDLSIDPSDQIKLKPIVKEHLYQQGNESMSHDVLYNVALYRNNHTLLPNKDYTFDRDLKLSFKPLDLHSQYHIAISALTDLNLLNPKWFGLIFKYFPVYPKYVRDFVRNRIETGAWTKHNWPNRVFLGEDGQIYDELGKVIDNLNNLDIRRFNDAYNPASRVFLYGIVARKAPISTSRITK